MAIELSIIGLTGGIATGKSTFVAILQRLLPECVVFDADACVHALYHHENIKDELVLNFGAQVVGSDGEVDRRKMREYVFENPEAKTVLEDIFHPRVRQECLALLEKTVKKASSRLFVADIPLLFENGFDFGQSVNALVATSGPTQVERLKNRSAWSDTTVQSVIAAQMPLKKKIIFADIVFWNEGPIRVLESQCERYLCSLGLMP